MNLDVKHTDPEQPPFLRSWKRLYSFVLGELLVLVVVFYVFMKFFS